jgi:hypothetical protein
MASLVSYELHSLPPPFRARRFAHGTTALDLCHSHARALSAAARRLLHPFLFLCLCLCVCRCRFESGGITELPFGASSAVLSRYAVNCCTQHISAPHFFGDAQPFPLFRWCVAVYGQNITLSCVAFQVYTQLIAMQHVCVLCSADPLIPTAHSCAVSRASDWLCVCVVCCCCVLHSV